LNPFRKSDVVNNCLTISIHFYPTGSGFRLLNSSISIEVDRHHITPGHAEQGFGSLGPDPGTHKAGPFQPGPVHIWIQLSTWVTSPQAPGRKTATQSLPGPADGLLHKEYPVR
jgi:hypothetical protein